VTNCESVEDKRLQELFVEITGETTLRGRQHEHSRTTSSREVFSATLDHRYVLGSDFDDGLEDAIGSPEDES
jgi:hypothetical protein